jgi:hypothetical protein
MRPDTAAEQTPGAGRTDSLVIPSRFCGPPGSGNGGFSLIRPALLRTADDECLTVAWPAAHDGRKLRAGSALLGPGGKVIAAARTVWLTVPHPVPALSAGGAS